VTAWRWLESDELAAIQAELVAEHGGLPRLRDRALLESAAARPKHLLSYGEPSVFDLAAAYAFGLARNRPFVDGNKRVALVAAFTFLELNGWEVEAEEAAAVLVFLDLAAGKLEEGELAAWLEHNSRRL
jgi:death-on-curing protein